METHRGLPVGRRWHFGVALAVLVLMATACGGAGADEVDAVATDTTASIAPSTSAVADVQAASTTEPVVTAAKAIRGRFPVGDDDVGPLRATVPPTEPTGSLATRDARLFMVGDSVLLSAWPATAARLPGWSVVADAEIARRVPAGAAVIEERRDEIGDVVVIFLGHNYSLGEGFQTQFNRIMGQVGTLDRVVWVTVGEWNTGSLEVNRIIRAAPSRWPNVVVADWAALTTADPGLVKYDRVHLTSSGVPAVANLIAAAVGPGPLGRVPGAVPGPTSPPPTRRTTTSTTPVADTTTTSRPASTSTSTSTSSVPATSTTTGATTTSVPQVSTTVP